MPAGALVRRTPAKVAAAAQADPRFQKLLAQLKGNAAKTKQHPPAARKAAEAQAAAKGPPNEKLAGAKAKQVDKMKEAEGKKPEVSGFVALLRAEIEKAMPKNLENATKFMQGGEKEQIKGAAAGNVSQQKAQAAGPVQQASAQAPSTAGVPAKEGAPIPEEGAPPPGAVDAGNAVPAPKPDADVSQEQTKTDADQQFKDAKVTPEQLQKANDPRFSAVLTAKSNVEKVATASPAKYRAGEKAALAEGVSKASVEAKKGLATAASIKVRSGAAVKSRQQLAKEKDEAERKKVTDTIEGIYNETKASVEKKLSTLEADVSAIFDRGINAALAAMQAYAKARIDRFYDERYTGVAGAARWLVDKFRDTPEGVKQILREARTRFTGEMDALAVQIGGVVDGRLKEAKNEVAKGQKRIDTYVKGLPRNLQAVGKEAQSAVADRFKELEQGIDSKAQELAQKLAQKYKEAHDKADEALKKIDEENKGAFKGLADKLGEVVKALMEFKDKLMAVLKKGQDAIEMILKDPIGFLGNLISAIKLGFNQFVGNIGAHMKRGFMQWLFGTLASAGIQIPSDFTLPSILKLVLDVLGLTYAWMRGEAVKLMGERNVALLEKLFEYIMITIRGGPAALWEKIKEDLGNLKAMVIDAIQTWLIDTVVKQAVAKVVSMFNPAGAIVQAVITIYNVVMFIVERASQIMALVEAVVNSVHAIASGAIGGAANWIEQALARMIPVAIGLLARLIGLGGLSDKIKEYITKVQTKVRAAVLGWLKKAWAWVKKLFGSLTGKKKDKKDEGPEHDAKVNRGLAHLRELTASSSKRGKLSRETAVKIAERIRRGNPVFKSISVIDGGETWDYDYVASPGKRDKGGNKDETLGEKLRNVIASASTAVPKGSLYRGDDNFSPGPIGIPLPQAQPSGPARALVQQARDEAEIQNPVHHVLKKKPGQKSIYTSFSQRVGEIGVPRSGAAYFTRAGSVIKIALAELAKLEAAGKIKIHTPAEVKAMILAADLDQRKSRGIVDGSNSKQAKTDANSVFDAMSKNQEVLIEGQIPEDIIIQVDPKTIKGRP
ncbi:phage tail protein [Sorangium sp. So ce1151]|uniref:phage tail protein n=1 Tax=Sorangium sp. So ce1151 TaxID=3133332 RepID=UPI003F60C31D